MADGSEQDERQRSGIPLEREGKLAEERARRCVEGLEQRSPERAAVDHVAPCGAAAARATVDPPQPAGVTEAVEPVRVLEEEQRLGAPVTRLLRQVRADAVASAVP